MPEYLAGYKIDTRDYLKYREGCFFANDDEQAIELAKKRDFIYGERIIELSSLHQIIEHHREVQLK